MLKTAINAAKKAGEIHLKYFNTDFKINHKSSHQDLVTIADTESEKEIVKIIKSRFSGHNILAEEGEYDKTDSEYTWIIDPLDGTNNFAHKIPIFCVSIALAKNNDVVLGVIYNPITNELFYAEKNKGAFLNDRKIHVTENKKLSDSILITGFYYDRGEIMRKTLDNIRDFFIEGIIGIRRFGSAALDLCNLASGRADGFWEHTLSPWDYAAGMLILKEAGGKVTDNKNKLLDIFQKNFIVASNSLIHDSMLEVINKKRI